MVELTVSYFRKSRPEECEPYTLNPKPPKPLNPMQNQKPPNPRLRVQGSRVSIFLLTQWFYMAR